MAGADVGDRCGEFAPLQDDVLRDLSVRVHVDALVVVAEQQLHAVRVWQRHDRVRCDGALKEKVFVTFYIKLITVVNVFN